MEAIFVGVGLFWRHPDYFYILKCMFSAQKRWLVCLHSCFWFWLWMKKIKVIKCFFLYVSVCNGCKYPTINCPGCLEVWSPLSRIEVRLGPPTPASFFLVFFFLNWSRSADVLHTNTEQAAGINLSVVAYGRWSISGTMNPEEQTVTWLISLGVLCSPKKNIADPEEFLKTSLKDGVVLCKLAERLVPGFTPKVSYCVDSTNTKRSERIYRREGFELLIIDQNHSLDECRPTTFVRYQT